MAKFYSDVNIDASNLTLKSAAGNKPLLTLEGSVDEQSDQPEIVFMKNSAAQDGEDLGVIRFKGLNDASTPETIQYAYILGEAIDVTDGSESGEITISASTTTLTGNLAFDGVTLTGVQTSSESFVDDDASIMTSAAIKDYVDTNGGGGVTFTQPAGGSANIGGHQGDVWYFGGSSTSIGFIYYLNSSGGWSPADANDTLDGAGEMLAVALGSNSTTHGMLLRGMVNVYEPVGSEDHGMKVYLSDNGSGQCGITAPTGQGKVVRILGYSLGSTTTNSNVIWFNPDNTFITLA